MSKEIRISRISVFGLRQSDGKVRVRLLDGEIVNDFPKSVTLSGRDYYLEKVQKVGDVFVDLSSDCPNKNIERGTYV